MESKKGGQDGRPKVMTESEINAKAEEIQKKSLADISCEILPNKPGTGQKT